MFEGVLRLCGDGDAAAGSEEASLGGHVFAEVRVEELCLIEFHADHDVVFEAVQGKEHDGSEEFRADRELMREAEAGLREVAVLAVEAEASLS